MVANEGDLRCGLVTKWGGTFRKTSQLLLKHLKSYHWAASVWREEEIKREESNLRKRTDYEESISNIYHHVNSVFQKLSKVNR